MSFGVPFVTPPIPGLESFSVTGDAGALRVHAGWLQNTSNVLREQGQQIHWIGGALAPAWNGEAATSFQTLSGNMAGAFGAAASTIEDAAGRLFNYATQLESLQTQAASASQQSQYWHDQIVTWTGRVNDAQTKLTRLQSELGAAVRAQTIAAAQGSRAAAEAASAGAAITRLQGEISSTQTELKHAQDELTHAHQQFTYWQNRARQIQGEATGAGEQLGAALAPMSIAPPPIPGPLINVPPPRDDGPLINVPPPRDDGPLINVPPPRDRGPEINVPWPGLFPGLGQFPGIVKNENNNDDDDDDGKGSGNEEEGSGKQDPENNAEGDAKVPANVEQTLEFITKHNGAAPQGYKGKGKYENDGRDNSQVLPKTEPDGKPITYKEYDVHPLLPGVDRGDDRLVVGSDGSVYYTTDHYKHCTRIR